MKDGKSDVVELTQEQRRLVDENVGLVGVHLRRSLGGLAQPRRDREWDDLFQEGCLGLVQAAVRFREERGIPFAAFAFPRIHNAVSRALQTKFSTVYVPPARHSRIQGEASDVESRRIEDRPQVRSMSDEVERNLPDRRHEPEEQSGETIGVRIRGKYERAVKAAVEAVGSGPSRRGDRRRLADVLAEERFLVPGEESRMALREIARKTQSSYARVAQCDKKMADAIRAQLCRDPEFRELSRLAKSHPEGASCLIDGFMERDLCDVASQEFVNRMHRADPCERARCVDLLVDRLDGSMDSFLRRKFQSLAPVDRERFFHRLDSDSAPQKEQRVNRRRSPDRV